jgi:hypothetical protein
MLEDGLELMFRVHVSARVFLVVVEFVVDCLVNEIQEDGEADFVVPLQLFQLGNLAWDCIGVEFLDHIVLHVSDLFLVRLFGWFVEAGNEREEFRVWDLGFYGFYFAGLVEVKTFISNSWLSSDCRRSGQADLFFALYLPFLPLFGRFWTLFWFLSSSTDE